MKLKRHRQIDVFFLAVCLAFIIDIGDVKYAFAALFVLFYAFLMGINNKKLATNGPEGILFSVLIGVLILTLITITRQLRNGFQSYAVNEVIYFITPIFFVWIYINNSNKKHVSDMLDIIFSMYVLLCLYKNLQNFSVENFRTINLGESYSAFESGYAYIFLLFEWLYFFQEKKTKAIFSYILCVFSFKRFCMLAATALLLFHKVIVRKNTVRRRSVLFAICGFVILPIVVCIALNQNFENWFYDVFGISLEKFTLSRSSRIVMLMESDEIKYGLGSSTVYLTKVFQAIHNSKVEQWNLHNDVVRILLECGLLGSIAFTASFFKAASFCRASLSLMIYIFMEAFFNHPFGAGSVNFWIIVYMMLVYARLDIDNSENT